MLVHICSHHKKSTLTHTHLNTHARKYCPQSMIRREREHEQTELEQQRRVSELQKQLTEQRSTAQKRSALWRQLRQRFNQVSNESIKVSVTNNNKF